MRARPRAFALLPVAMTLLVAGCECAQRAQDAADAAEGAVGAPPPLIALPELPDDARVALPRPGRVMVGVSEKGVTLLANQVSRLRVLQSLQRAARFELAVAAGTEVSGEITLRAVDVALDAVLARLLEGIPYSSHYGVEVASGGRVLERVVVGEIAEAQGVASSSPEEPTEEPDAPKRELTEREREERAVRREQRQVEYLVAFDDEDPDVRAEAAEWIHGEPDVVPALADLLARDPSPRVRAAAAETLGEARESSAAGEAMQALLRALDDPNSEVVIEALDALEWIGDKSIVPEVSRLIDHPDPDVREAAIDAIEWVADD